MNTIKYISFENVTDLEEKLQKLREIKKTNLLDIENWLIMNKISFQKMPDGSFMIDTESVSHGTMEEYQITFLEMAAKTKREFKELGVVYTVDGFIDIKTAECDADLWPTISSVYIENNIKQRLN